jgi:hypothetical protein
MCPIVTWQQSMSPVVLRHSRPRVRHRGRKLSEAVRRAVIESGCRPVVARFAVRIEFRLGPSRTAGEVWDLDNLIKPTLDAMEGVFGLRQWRGRPQPADDRVDRIEATKRIPSETESPGATIDVWVIE